MLDILARNAFLEHPSKIYQGQTSRGALTAGDLFNPDIVETVRVHLEENEIPGVVATEDSDIPTIVCVTTPRVIKDIRTGSTSKWLELQEYAGGTKKFTGEVGSWAGVRFVRTNRLRLRNHGAVSTQTTLAQAAPAGTGASQTVDAVYTVGQSNATRYITVATGAAANFSALVGKYITLHSQNSVSAGEAPVEGDGTQETRRIISVDTVNDRITLNKPLLKDHASGDFVTNGIDVHSSLFMGGPGVVYGVGERPGVVVPPKYDDLQMINRFGWRGFLKFQMFRPEYFEVCESAGSTD